MADSGSKYERERGYCCVQAGKKIISKNGFYFFLPSERYFAFKTISFIFIIIIHYLLSFLKMTVIDPQKEGSN